jgi:hypothetical protein
VVAASLAPGGHRLAMGISTPDGLADKDAREAEIIQALDHLAAPVADGGFGRYPATFPFWTNFAEYPGQYTPRATFLTTTMLDALDARGITPMIYMQPVGPGIDRTRNNTIDEAMPYSNASIAAGSFDDFLRAWAEAAAAYGKPVVLRYAWEMNGNWFPWSPTQDRTRYFDLGNTPANYRLAWQHVYTLIHDIAPNVKFFWCPTVTGIANAAAYSPGPEYVDYVGVDGYARGPVQTMATVLGPGLATVRTLPGAAALPMLVGETGVLSTNPSRDRWLTDGYEALYERFRQLDGIVYFDFDMTNVFGKHLESGDWQIESDPAALSAYTALSSDPRFQGTLGGPVPITGPTPSAVVPAPAESPSPGAGSASATP